MKRALPHLFLVALLAAGAACGGDGDAAVDTARPMSATLPDRAAREAGPANVDPVGGHAAGPEEPAPRVAAPNRPPRVVGIQIEPAEHLEAGRPVTVVARALDPDGDGVTLHYEWAVNGEVVEADANVLDTSGLVRGDTVVVRVSASDGARAGAAVASPELRIENALPVIRSVPGATAVDGSFRYQVVAEDPDAGSSLVYSLAAAPDGMRISRVGGLVEWRPGPEQAGTHAVAVVVEDDAGGRRVQSFQLSTGPPQPAPANPR